MINHAVSFNTPIIHVAVAVADTDETYGAYAAAEKILLLIQVTSDIKK